MSTDLLVSNVDFAAEGGMPRVHHARAETRHGQNELGSVIGRKNWLFVGSDDGAAANVAFTSLLASCRMHEVEPWRYLRDIFCLLPDWPAHRLLELSPLHWKETSALPEVQQLLDGNVYRRVTLLDGSPGGGP